MKREIFSVETFSDAETKKVAGKLAREIVKKNTFPIVIALNGDLGAGKTTFVKGFAKGLGIKETVVSPTFTLIQSYPLHPTPYTLHHIDPYRLDDSKTIISDVKELLKEKDAIIVIEWADIVKEILPKNTILIELTHKGENKRELKIYGKPN